VTALEKVSEAGVGGAAGELDALGAVLVKIVEKSGDAYEGIIALDRKGTVVSDGVGGKTTGIELGDRAYFLAAKEGRATVSNAVKSKLTGNVIAPVCAPVLSDSGDFIGAVAFVTDIDFIASLITSTTIGETGYAFMVNQEAVVIAHPNAELILEEDISEVDGMREIADKMVAGEAGVKEYTYEGSKKISGFAPVALTGWSICTAQPTDEFMASVYAMRNVTLVIGIVFLVATVLLVFYFVRGISVPIKRIIRNLDEGADQVAEASGEISNAGSRWLRGLPSRRPPSRRPLHPWRKWPP
jgi:methyl-accepting chemotaxis protein